MNKLGETNSDEWNKIKGWMGAANGKKDHPLVQEAKRAQRVQKFDEGSADVEPDAETMKFLQPQGAGLIAPSAAQPPAVQPPPVQAPMPAPQAPVQPPPQMPPQAPPQAAPPAPTQDYSSQAANELGTSPQELAAFIQKANTPTTGDTIRGVGASLADALGRAGGSNPNYLEQNNKVELARREAMTGIPGKQVEAGKEKFGLTEQLQAKDPNSPYSRIVQNSERPNLKALGWTDAQINQVPAVAAQDAVQNGLKFEDVQSKYGLEAATIKQTGAYQRGMQDIQRQGLGVRQQEANTRDKSLRVEHPVASALNDILSGGNSQPSSGWKYIGPVKK